MACRLRDGAVGEVPTASESRVKLFRVTGLGVRSLKFVFV